jgi:hypothetical protein
LLSTKIEPGSLLPIKAIRIREEMMQHLGPSEPFKANRRRMYWLLRLLGDGFQSFVFRHVVRKVEDELYRLPRVLVSYSYLRPS